MNQRSVSRPRRRVAGIALSAAIVLTSAACGNDEAGGADDLGLAQEGTVSVGYMNGLMPYVGQEKGELTGVDGDLFAAAVEGTDLEIEAQGMEFSAMIAGVQAGRYDIDIGGIAWTEEREKEGIFSDPVYYSPALLLTKPGLTIESTEDLDGLQVGAVTGTLNDEATRATPGVTAKTYPAWAQAISDLEAGRLDAVNIDPLTAVYMQETRPDLKDFGTHVIEPPSPEAVEENPGLQGYRPYQVVWYCSAKAENLCAQLSETIRGMYTDGTSAKILTEWGVDAQDFLTVAPDAAEQRIGVDREEGWVPPSQEK